MKSLVRTGALKLGLMLMLALVLAASVACWGERIVDLIIENQTEQVLIVTLDGGLVGEVLPGSRIIRKDLTMSLFEYLIEAKNTAGEIVFSQVFTFEDLQKVDARVYKFVISPSTE